MGLALQGEGDDLSHLRLPSLEKGQLILGREFVQSPVFLENLDDRFGQPGPSAQILDGCEGPFLPGFHDAFAAASPTLADR